MNLLVTSLYIVFGGVIVAPVLTALMRRGTARSVLPWLLGIIPLASFVTLALMVPAVQDGETIIEHYSWISGLRFNLNLHLDGLSLLFAMLITGIGTLIVVYAGEYLSRDEELPLFYGFLFLFMGAMLGMVLADNIFVLFIFWELTSVSSFFLIGHKHEEKRARKSALQALLVTGMGGLALLAGLILLANAAASPNISEWRAAGNAAMGVHSAILESEHFLLALVLLLLGAFTKSAQFPFHFWLPNAMVAPTPVSAFLHSATMVKAGIYLLARLNPYMEQAIEWRLSLTFSGGITMVMGAVWALFQTDLKRILAYTTISALGVMVFAIGIGSARAIQGMAVFLLAHACYKGALFMIAGNIDHATGTRDVSLLSGLAPKMRITAVAAVLAALSMAGFPLLQGFLAKELIYEATMHSQENQILFTLASFLTSVIFVAVAFLLGWKIFFSSTPHLTAHEVPAALYMGPLILGVGGLLAGIFPHHLTEKILARAADAVSSDATGLTLHVWHGFTMVLALSAFTLLAGWLLYRVYEKKLKHLGSRLLRTERFGPEVLLGVGWRKLTGFAEKLTIFTQTAYLRSYIMTILGVFFALLILTMVYYGNFGFIVSTDSIDLYEVIIGLVVAVAIVFTVLSRSRLAAVAILGVVGYGVALFYAMYGGPDLAMTQFLVETLTMVVFVYILYQLPGYMKFTFGRHQLRDFVFALLGGATLTVVILLIVSAPLQSGLKEYYSANSFLLAHGRNVVNTILVDFRAMDTMGEIAVLAISALGVTALMKLKIK